MDLSWLFLCNIFKFSVLISNMVNNLTQSFLQSSVNTHRGKGLRPKCPRTAVWKGLETQVGSLSREYETGEAGPSGVWRLWPSLWSFNSLPLLQYEHQAGSAASGHSSSRGLSSSHTTTGLAATEGSSSQGTLALYTFEAVGFRLHLLSRGCQQGAVHSCTGRSLHKDR